MDLLYSFSGEAACSDVRTIQSGVDEYSILPGNPSDSDKTLVNFIKAISGIAMDDEVDTEALVQHPKKGLSPIARIKKGEPFRILELHMVLIAELRTAMRQQGHHCFVICGTLWCTWCPNAGTTFR